jgi:crotonobetainyl-CoA:carnitine CoA-transferase CaiB-like acyl-CoA transferase
MPMRAGIPIGDIASGLFAAIGIVSVLHDTASAGTRRNIDVSMLDCQVSMLNYMATMHFLSGKNPVQEGNSHFAHVPYNTFRTTGRYIIVCCLQDQAWTALTEVLGLQDLQREEFARQPGRLKAKAYLEERCQAVLETQSCEYWLEKLEAARIPCAPVNDFEHALREPQIVARNMVVPVEHPEGGSTFVPGNPIKIGDVYDDRFTYAPRLGADTARVLSEMLGIDRADAEDLTRRGIVA